MVQMCAPFRHLILILSKISLLLALDDASDCHFADLYRPTQLFESPSLREEFFRQIAHWEGRFAADGIGVDSRIAATTQGIGMDAQTGGYRGQLQFLDGDRFVTVSRPEHEAIHLALLSLAVTGNSYALTFFNASMPTGGNNQTVHAFVVEQMGRKIANYRRFFKQYPAFGGYLPAMLEIAEDGTLKPLNNSREIHGDEHGALCWALTAARQVTITYCCALHR